MVHEEALEQTPSPALPQIGERDLGEGAKRKQKKIGRKGKAYVPIAAGDGVAFDDTENYA